MRLVKIEWVDSFGCETDWSSLDNLVDADHMCISVGFLAKEGEHVTVIVPHYYKGDDKAGYKEQGCGEMSVPNISIISIIDLVPVETKES